MNWEEIFKALLIDLSEITNPSNPYDREPLTAEQEIEIITGVIRAVEKIDDQTHPMAEIVRSKFSSKSLLNYEDAKPKFDKLVKEAKNSLRKKTEEISEYMQ